MPLPEWARERPRIAEGDEWYVHAFWELSSTRAIGMGMGPIPWHHVVDYGARSGLDEGMIRVMVKIIRALDHAYLHWNAEEGDRKNQHRRKEKDAR